MAPNDGSRDPAADRGFDLKPARSGATRAPIRRGLFVPARQWGNRSIGGLDLGRPRTAFSDRVVALVREAYPDDLD